MDFCNLDCILSLYSNTNFSCTERRYIQNEQQCHLILNSRKRTTCPTQSTQKKNTPLLIILCGVKRDVVLSPIATSSLLQNKMLVVGCSLTLADQNGIINKTKWSAGWAR